MALPTAEVLSGMVVRYQEVAHRAVGLTEVAFSIAIRPISRQLLADATRR
jgi:hypothetical protein